MSKGLNKVQIIGYLGKDPEMRYTGSGAAVCAFSVAVTETWKDKDSGEKKESTEWFSCEAWNKLAEICGEWLKKGSRVYVEGRMKTDTWEKDGVKQYRQKVRIDSMIMLSSVEKSPSEEAAPQNGPKTQGKFDDDLPF
jgi:single-strand DNA-binding protein